MRKRRDRVLEVGGIIHALTPRPGLTPAQNWRRDRLTWALRDPFLRLVPRRLRAVRALRRFYWQQAEVDDINRTAHELAEQGVLG